MLSISMGDSAKAHQFSCSDPVPLGQFVEKGVVEYGLQIDHANKKIFLDLTQNYRLAQCYVCTWSTFAGSSSSLFVTSCEHP